MMTTKRKPTDRLMSQSAAAKLLGMHRGTVLARVAAGEIEAETVDGTPVLVRASVEAYARRLARASERAA